MEGLPSLTFGELLKRLRKRADLTQEELAQAAGLSQRTISDLERGVARAARKETARLLADALGLDGPERAEFEASARGRVATGGFQAQAGMEIGAAAGAMRTLPRDIKSFTGRGPELRELLRAASRGADSAGVVGIYAIGGMAGIGKTAFAVHAAHELADRFPDGQIFLPLHGHTPGQPPVDPADALASLLLTAGVGAQQIPPSLEARTQLWRARLVGKSLLLLLDDAAGHDQVRPLLPGTAGSVVLVTSRRHLTALEDASAISLDIFNPREAAQLLVRLAKRPGLKPADSAVADICRLSGYLPLAIGMLAAQLCHHPTWTAAEQAAELAQARERLELMRVEDLSVAAAFDLSYRDLTPDQQRLFRRLGLHAGPDIDVYAAAAMDGTDVETARQLLNGIYDQYLIDEPVHGRYRLHDLIREHARTLAGQDSPAERDEAINRLLDYYLFTARAVSRRLSVRGRAVSRGMTIIPPAHTPDLPARQAALTWMRAERLNLHAAVGYAAAHERLGYAIAIPAAMHAYLRNYGPWDQALVLHGTAVDAARVTGDQRAEADALDDLAWIQRVTANRTKAVTSLNRALELYRGLGDKEGEADALTHLARVQHLTDKYGAATAGLTRALDLYRSVDSQLGEAHALYELAVIERLTDLWPEAEAKLTRALELFREFGDLEGEAHAVNELGNLQYQTDNYPAAAATLREALKLYRELGNENGEANTLRDLGVVQSLTGDMRAAQDSQERALKVYRRLASRLGEANTRYELGIILREYSRPSGGGREHDPGARAVPGAGRHPGRGQRPHRPGGRAAASRGLHGRDRGPDPGADDLPGHWRRGRGS